MSRAFHIILIREKNVGIDVNVELSGPRSVARPKSVTPQQPSRQQKARVGNNGVTVHYGGGDDARCGLDQDLKDKAARNYDVGLEERVQQWIEGVTGAPFDDNQSFAENLKYVSALVYEVRGLRLRVS